VANGLARKAVLPHRPHNESTIFFRFAPGFDFINYADWKCQKTYFCCQFKFLDEIRKFTYELLIDQGRIITGVNGAIQIGLLLIMRHNFEKWFQDYRNEFVEYLPRFMGRHEHVFKNVK